LAPYLITFVYVAVFFGLLYLSGRTHRLFYGLEGLALAWPVVLPVLAFVWVCIEVQGLGERHRRQ
jgi:hypothetical protein